MKYPKGKVRFFSEKWHDEDLRITSHGLNMMRFFLIIGVILGFFMGFFL